MRGATLQAGDLRQRITIQDPTATVTGQDSFGGPSVTTAPAIVADNIPARVLFVSAKQIFSAQQLVSQVTHEVTIRWMTGIKAKQEVLFDGRVFEIQAVENPDERHIMLVLLCLERESRTA